MLDRVSIQDGRDDNRERSEICEESVRWQFVLRGSSLIDHALDALLLKTIEFPYTELAIARLEKDDDSMMAH